jgi:hypothetical protein
MKASGARVGYALFASLTAMSAAKPVPAVSVSAVRRERAQGRTALAESASFRRCRRKPWIAATAISGDMPRFSFTSSDSVVRVTPRAAEASVMLKPNGSMH